MIRKRLQSGPVYVGITTVGSNKVIIMLLFEVLRKLFCFF